MTASIGRVVVLVVVVMIGACGGDRSGGPTPEDLTGPGWALSSGTVDGEQIPLVEGHTITLVFDETTIGGTAACNSYGADYTLSGPALVLADLFWTEMGCSPEIVMESERRYLDALAKVNSIALDDDRLTLSGEGIELIFAAMPEVPTAELSGTVWVLESLIDGDAVSTVGGERATLELFSDGSMLGSTGCRTLSGNYTQSGSDVAIAGLEAAGNCDDDLREQDSQVTAVLGDVFRASIEANTLTVSSGSLGLVYRAQS